MHPRERAAFLAIVMVQFFFLNCSFFSPQKGAGYHLDLLLVAIIIGICSLLGLPWVVAATVLSVGHVQSLFVESQCTAPGEKVQFLGVRYVNYQFLVYFSFAKWLQNTIINILVFVMYTSNNAINSV